MSVQGPGMHRTFTAAADLSAKQYFTVKLTAKNTVGVTAAATDISIGILQNNPASGLAAEVRMCLPTSLAVTDGSSVNIAAGDYLGPNNAGKLVKKATADYGISAIANDASTTDGAIIEVFMLSPGFFRTAAG